jgi:uncharacterized membrane protein YgcG
MNIALTAARKKIKTVLAALVTLAAGICFLSLPVSAAIPPKPDDLAFFHDLAGLRGIVSSEDREAITNLQQKTFRETGVPIVAVTIDGMSQYDAESPSFESFAHRWFDIWGIGAQEKNDGMLIIVSRGDRKARIELGALWGRKLDPFCKHLMDNEMVPRFRAGDYGKGLLVGVTRLSQIARKGAGALPSNPSIEWLDRPSEVSKPQTTDLPRPVDEETTPRPKNDNNPLIESIIEIAKIEPPFPATAVLIVGVGFIVAGIFAPKQRKILLIIGAALITLALIFWLVVMTLFFAFLILILIMGKSKTSYSSWSSGSDFGGFGGGSSGGGGASGSW